MRQFNGHVLFKLPPSQLQTAQHARKGKVFHSWHLLTQTYFLLSLYVRTHAHLIHTISSTSLHLNNLRNRWVSIGSSFLILHLLYNTLLTCIYLSSLHASWLWTNTFIQWVLEWLRALGLHWPPPPAKVWATRDIQWRRHTRCIVGVIAQMNGLLTYWQPGDHVFVPGSRSKCRRHAIFIQYDWKMLGRKVIRIH